MSSQQRWEVRGRRLARAGVVVLALGGAVACTPYATLRTLPTDCDVTDAYEFMNIDNFEGEASPHFFPTSDDTPGSVLSLTLATPPGGTRCGSMEAMEIQSSGNNDWGSLTGFSNFGSVDASAYEGISLWAEAPGSSNRAFTMLLDDPNTYNMNMTPMPPIYYCTPVPTEDGGTGVQVTIIDSVTGMVLSSGTSTAPVPPDGCGNDYSTVVQVTGVWQFYTIPFGDFQQSNMQNKVPNGALGVTGTAPGTALITSALKTFTLRFPKGIYTNLWVDDIAFYRKKGTGADGGVDAP